MLWKGVTSVEWARKLIAACAVVSRLPSIVHETLIWTNSYTCLKVHRVLFTDTAVEHTNRSSRHPFETRRPHLRMNYAVSEGVLTCRRTSSPRTQALARAQRQQSGRAWCLTNPLVLFSSGLVHYCGGIFPQCSSLPLKP